MKKNIWLLFLCCFPGWITVHGQLARKNSYTGMGTYTDKQTDAFSFIAQQAALANTKTMAAGIYHERIFLLPELSNYTAVMVFPVAAGSAGIKAGFSGYTAYKEMQAGLAFGRKLGNDMNAGIQFNYTGVNIPGYRNAAAWSVELGMILRLTDKLHAGIQLNNPVGGNFLNTLAPEKLPAIYTFGGCYEAGDQFYLQVLATKEEDQPVNVQAGLHYVIVPSLFLRMGIASAGASFYTGVGLRWKKTRMDITGSYHPQLGITPGLLLLYTISTTTP